MHSNMTGKELILYILQNNLEDAPIFNDGRFLDLMTISEAAVYYKTGEATVRVWLRMGKIKGIKINNEVMIPKIALDNQSLCII